MSQATLAAKANVCPMTISRIERGQFFPYFKTRQRIAAVFGVKPETIFRDPIVFNPDLEIKISCRRCHMPIVGLSWNPRSMELIIRKMPRAAKVHKNGFFYHESCIEEKLRILKLFPNLDKFIK